MNKNKKSTIQKYSDLIEKYVEIIKKNMISEFRAKEEIDFLKITEDYIFNDKKNDMEIEHIPSIIECVYERVSGNYGILDSLINDESINEIMVNGISKIFIEQHGKLKEINNAFTSKKELEELIRSFAINVHREINEVNPIVDARLDNGFRINGVLDNVAINGPILTIRKFRNRSITLKDLIDLGSISDEINYLLSILVKAKYNIFISGGTSSGKTTFLNALSGEINHDERVIVIEDSAELFMNNINNKVQMECRSANSIGKGEITMSDLIKTSLRMRPDRIIVGEVRGHEVIDMIQAMSTGHDGSMSTGHGNSIAGMLHRLETMYLMGSEIPIASIRSQIANAVDIFIHLMRDENGKRKVVEIAELVGFYNDNYKLNYLFTTDSENNFKRTNNKLIQREKLGGIADDRF